MGEETYLWNQKRIATGAYAVGDVMVYAAGDTVQRSTGAPEEVFAGIARNTGTSGSACTMAKPPGLVLVKNGLSSPAPVGLSLDAGVNGSAVAALGTRTLGVLTRSALPTDSRVLVDLRT